MEQEPEDQSESQSVSFDTSHALDMVTLFDSSNHDAEMEAMAIHSILQASGIPSVLVGASTIPVLSFQVQVPKANLEEAQRVLAEAQAAGPAAAAEAEAASEQV
jgi:aryl-alcohol dehydrogenase-like predicted oxidoreductase